MADERDDDWTMGEPSTDESLAPSRLPTVQQWGDWFTRLGVAIVLVWIVASGLTYVWADLPPEITAMWHQRPSWVLALVAVLAVTGLINFTIIGIGWLGVRALVRAAGLSETPPWMLFGLLLIAMVAFAVLGPIVSELVLLALSGPGRR